MCKKGIGIVQFRERSGADTNIIRFLLTLFDARSACEAELVIYGFVYYENSAILLFIVAVDGLNTMCYQYFYFKANVSAARLVSEIETDSARTVVHSGKQGLFMKHANVCDSLRFQKTSVA